MKTIGMIGGMSWESSAVYYNEVNRQVKKTLGGYHSAKCILLSLDFDEVEILQSKNDWNGLNNLMVLSAQKLEKAGADLVILCTNTMHLCSAEIIKNISVPFLHIAKATAKEIQKQGLQKIGLLGTKFTMEKDFYTKILNEYGIEVLIPPKEDREIVHQVIYNELVLGNINNSSKKEYIRIIKNLKKKGAQGVILGCTEIPLLIKTTDVDIPIFDTTKIHAKAAVKMALQK